MQARTQKSRWLALWMLLGTAGGLSAQTQPGWRFWDKNDGFEESYARVLSVDTRGRVWIRHGAVHSMSLLDGYKITRLPEPRTGAIESWAWFVPVYAAPSGIPWAVENRSLKRLDGETWRVVYSGPDGDNRLLAAIPIEDDRLFVMFAHEFGEYRPSTRTWTYRKNSSESALGRFARMRPGVAGEVWITGGNGVARVNARADGVEWHELPLAGMGLYDPDYPLSSRAGDVHFAATARDTRERVLVHWTGEQAQIVYRGSPRNLRGWQGQGDTLWVVEGLSVFSFEHGRKTIVERSSGLGGVIYDVAPQPDGSFFLATSDAVIRYAPPLWQTPAPLRDLDIPVHSFLEDRRGRFWVAATDYLIERDGERWSRHPLPRDMRTHTLQSSALADFGGGKIALKAFEADMFDRMLVWDPATARFQVVEHPEGRTIKVFAVNPDDDTLWVVTSPGCRIETFDGHRFRTFRDLTDYWKGPEVRSMLVGKNGDIWVGNTSAGGVLRKSGQFDIAGPAQGFRDGMFSVAEASPGEIVAGGRETLYRYENGSWRVLRAGFDRVRSILRTRDGSLWVAAMSGVYRYLDGNWIAYAPQEGLPSSTGYRLFEDASGRLWAGTSRGASVFLPGADESPPRTFFPASGNLAEISPSGSLRAVMGALDKWKSTPADRLLFSYRLDGGPWSEFAPLATASFERLGYGRHRLEARAMDRNGRIDPSPARYQFRVLLPWYRQPGFLVTTFLSAIAIALLVYLAVAQFRQRGRLIAQLDGAKTAAEAASAYKSQFLANMSHEIRTPMNAIIGMTQLALRTCTEEERTEYLSTVRDSAKALLSILNDILDFSKVEAGRLELTNAPFRVDGCVEEALRTLSGKAAEKGLKLEARVDPRLPSTLVGDAVRLRQILLNLAGNALKFTERGKVTIEARSEEAFPDGSVLVHFAVRDTGIGIPAEKQRLVFAPFEQGDNSVTRRFGGTGLGLAIAASLANLMNGRIWVESPWSDAETGESSKGSAFHVTVRLPKAGGAVAPAKPELEPVRRPERSLCVLLAEDNAVNQKLMVRLLEKEGHQVMLAGDGEQAVSLFEKRSPDVVLMDVQMPKMDGLEAAAAIRRLERSSGAHVPIVALTAHALKGDSDRCLAAGMDCYITKPIETESLLRLVAKLGQASAMASDSDTLPGMPRRQTPTRPATDSKT